MTFEPYPPASGAAISDHLFFDTVAEMKATAPNDGDQCHTAGYSAVGDGGGSDGYTFHATGQSLETEDGGFVIFGAADSWFSKNDQAGATSKQFGCVIDGSTDDLLKIEALLLAVPEYGWVTFSEGVHIISKSILPRRGQTLTFEGSIKLDDLGVAVTAMVSVPNADVTLVNPQIDFDKDNNIDNGTGGTQSCIQSYSVANNLRITGGHLQNARHNGFQGGRPGLIIDGTKISGTGEHAIYLNGDAGGGTSYSNVTLRNLEVAGTMRGATNVHEGHAVQIRNMDDVTITGGHYDCDGGSQPLVTDDSFYFLLDNCERVHISGGFGRRNTHKAFNITATCVDVTIDGFTAIRDGTGTAQTKTAVSSATTDVRVTNCTFRGYQVNDAGPRKWTNCKFLEIDQECFADTVGGVTFQNCEFSYITPLTIGGPVSHFRLREPADFLECEFSATDFVNLTKLIWVPAAEILDTDQCTVRGCMFTDWDEKDAIHFQAGGSHQIIDNRFPAVTAQDRAVYLSAGVVGVSTIDGNHFPALTGNGILVDAGIRFSPTLVAFDTLALAVASSIELIDGQQVTTAGYSAVGDGGGSADGYTYHSTGQSLETEDGGFVIFGTAGDDYLTANNQSVVDVAQFGAPESADGTVAITLAMEAAIAAGVPLRFQAAKSYETDQLRPTGSLIIEATGASLEFKTINGIRVDAGVGLTIRGGTFLQSVTGGITIYIDHSGVAGDVDIRNATFIGAADVRVAIWASSSITDAPFVRIVDCVIKTFEQSGIQFSAGKILDCEINGCLIEDIIQVTSGIGTTGISVGTNVETSIATGRIQISNNSVKRVQESNPDAHIGILAYGRRVAVTDNYLEDCWSDSGGDAGIYTKATHCIKTGNRLHNSGGGVAAIASKGELRIPVGVTPFGFSTIVANNVVTYDGNYPGSSRIGCLMGSEETVCNNRFEGCSTGIQAGEIDNGNVHDNYFRDLEHAAVTFPNARNLAIRNNQVDGWLGIILGGIPVRAIYIGQNAVGKQTAIGIVIENNQTFNTAVTVENKYIVYLNAASAAIDNVQILYNETLDPNILNVYDSSAAGTLTNIHTESISDERPTGWKSTGHRRSLTQAALGKVGEVCVTAGRPGTWKPYGAIDA